MSLEKRLKSFQAEVVAKNLVVAKHQSYISSFRRLYLTRRAAEFIFCALIVFGGHQLIIQNGFFSALWPASGVALSALFLRGNTMLLGIFFGTLSSTYTTIIPRLSVSIKLYSLRFLYFLHDNLRCSGLAQLHRLQM